MCAQSKGSEKNCTEIGSNIYKVGLLKLRSRTEDSENKQNLTIFISLVCKNSIPWKVQ